MWRADGRELFYLGPDGMLMAVAIRAGGSIDAGSPQTLFQTHAWRVTLNQAYAATKDGQRFLVNATPQPSNNAPPLTVVLNWMLRG